MAMGRHVRPWRGQARPEIMMSVLRAVRRTMLRLVAGTFIWLMAVVPLRVMRTAVVAWAEIDVPRPFVPVVSVVSVVVGSFVVVSV